MHSEQFFTILEMQWSNLPTDTQQMVLQQRLRGP